MMAIDDDAAPAVCVMQSCTNDTRLAAAQRRHGIEQMREPGKAMPQGIFYHRVGGVGVSGGNDYATCCKQRNHLWCGHLRRECYQRPADVERRQKCHRIAIERTKLTRIVRTLAGCVQKRSFEVHANDAGYVGGHRVANCIDCAGDYGKIIANQGRQKAGGAKASMRRRHGANSRHTWVIIEQHAAATVDLNVDETR